MASEGRPGEEEVFARAREIADAGERSAYLDSACEGDAELRGRVEALLAANGVRDGFLESADIAFDVTLPPEEVPLAEARTMAPGNGDGQPEPPQTEARGSTEFWPDIPGFKILEKIGAGGMGVVYKARQIGLNRTVAVKMLLAGRLATELSVKRFRAEAEAAASLEHPGIVPIYGTGEYEGHHYYTMGFVEGTSLAEAMSAGPLPARQAAEVIWQTAEAVVYAHARGVIHRDIKPANVLVDSQGRPRVTDFGLAKQTDSNYDLTASGQILGTPSYMAPEQAHGRHEDVKEAADCYALGATLFALLAGRPPFQGESELDTLVQVVREEPPALRQLNPAVPRDLETICLKCLEKAPEKRYGSTADLAEDLRRYLDGEPILARPPGPLGRLARWARRNPSLAVTLTALSVFYVVHLVCLFALGMTSDGGAFHRFFTFIVPLWALGCWAFHKLALRPAWESVALYGRFAMHTMMVTVFLLAGSGPRGALAIAYMLLVSAAGLYFRLGLVWFTTALTIAGYMAIWLEARLLRVDNAVSVRFGLYYVVALFVMGFVTHLILRRARLRSGIATGSSTPPLVKRRKGITPDEQHL
jgi:tRNA A-37 threonylcarbamoyl transferase component Bud32